MRKMNNITRCSKYKCMGVWTVSYTLRGRDVRENLVCIDNFFKSIKKNKHDTR